MNKFKDNFSSESFYPDSNYYVEHPVTEVITGIRKDGNLEVLEGLNANEKVVKEGLARLADGMTVRPLTK